MAHYNDGRGVVLIGHSQGSFRLERLIESQIDNSPSARRLLVSAILLGGDVVVADGSTTGGTFRHVPACTSSTETGCVVAYSSWSRTPPPDAGLQQVNGAKQHVLCVNPAAPGSTASTPITPIFAGINPQMIVPVREQVRRLPLDRVPRPLHGPLRSAGHPGLAARLANPHPR